MPRARNNEVRETYEEWLLDLFSLPFIGGILFAVIQLASHACVWFVFQRHFDVAEATREIMSPMLGLFGWSSVCYVLVSVVVFIRGVFTCCTGLVETDGFIVESDARDTVKLAVYTAWRTVLALVLIYSLNSPVACMLVDAVGLVVLISVSIIQQINHEQSVVLPNLKAKRFAAKLNKE